MDRNVSLIILALMGCTFIAVLVFIDRAYPELNTTTILKKSDRHPACQEFPFSCGEAGQ